MTGTGGAAQEAPTRRKVPPAGSLSTGVTAGQGLRALVLVAVWVLGAVGLAVVAHFAGLVNLRSARVVVAVLAVMTAAAMAAVYLHLVRRLDLTPAALGFAKPRWRLLHLLWQLPVTIVSAAGIQALVLVVSTGSATRAPGSGDALALAVVQLPAPLVILAFLVAVVGTPLWEETLFRGALLSGLAGKVGNPLAILLTAAAVSYTHLTLPTTPYV